MAKGFLFSISALTLKNLSPTTLSSNIFNYIAIPFILCTGYSSQISEGQVKAEGIRAFAKKPLTMNKIATLLRNVLDQKKTLVSLI